MYVNEISYHNEKVEVIECHLPSYLPSSFLQLALLCGAPGLGKTTLAHIIARHAGYNVVEMNARSALVASLAVYLEMGLYI